MKEPMRLLLIKKRLQDLRNVLCTKIRPWFAREQIRARPCSMFHSCFFLFLDLFLDTPLLLETWVVANERNRQLLVVE